MHRWFTAVSGCLVALGLVAASPSALGQTYNPETGGNLISGVEVTLTPGDRVNSGNEQIGPFGVAKCQSLSDNESAQATVRFQLNQSYLTRGNITLDDALLMEFPTEEGIQGSCTRDQTDGCRRLNEDDSGIRITEGQSVIEVQIDFDRLLDYMDDRTEQCSYATPSMATSGPLIPLQSDAGSMDLGLDAGDTSMDAAGDTAPPQDTSTPPSDTGTTGDATGDTNVVPSEGADRIYAVRLFLTGERPDRGGLSVEEEQHVVDGALELDRTRPAAPANLRAAASENKIRVEFDTPDNTNEIKSYHVFYSTSQLQQPNNPERLEDQENVSRRTLTSANEEDGVTTASVEGVGLKSDTTLYMGVATRDGAENFSTLGQPEEPLQVQQSPNPFEDYLGEGGSERGGCGCSASNSTPVSLLLAAFLLVGAGGRRLFGSRRS